MNTPIDRKERERVALRELAERSEGGILVKLFWNDTAPPGSDVSVEYHDESRGVFYIFYPPRDRVLESFYDPKALASAAEAWSMRAVI